MCETFITIGDLWQAKYWRYIMLATNESWTVWGGREDGAWWSHDSEADMQEGHWRLNPLWHLGKAHWSYLNKYGKPCVMQRITFFNKWKRIINNSHWISSARNWIFCVLSIFRANAVSVFVSLSGSLCYLTFAFSNLNLKLQFKNQLVTICSVYLIHFIMISSFLLWGAKLWY